MNDALKYVAIPVMIGAGFGAIKGKALSGFEKKKDRNKYLLQNIATGGLAGLLVGRNIREFQNIKGYSYGGRSHSGRSYREPPTTPTHMPELKSVKTKDAAKNIYRSYAIKNHPDKGGSIDSMQKINREWDNFKQHRFDKLSKLFSSLGGYFAFRK